MLTEKQKQVVLDYVRFRLQNADSAPAYRAEFVVINGVRYALPANEIVGVINTDDGKTIGVRTDAQGRIVYGHRVKLTRRGKLSDPP